MADSLTGPSAGEPRGESAGGVGNGVELGLENVGVFGESVSRITERAPRRAEWEGDKGGGESVAAMGLLGAFESRQSSPENPKLRKALARLTTRANRENRARLYEHVLNGPLLVALRALPSGLGRGPLDPAAESTIQFVTAAGTDGRGAIAAFSDPAAVAARAPAAVWLAIDPHALLTWIGTEGAGGLVLNPAGLSAFIPSEDVRELVGLQAARRRQSRSADDVSAPEKTIREALNSLYDKSQKCAFLVLREPRTEKAVRFARALDGSLMLDVSAATLSRDEIQRAKLMFDDLAGCADDLPRGECDAEPTSFKAIFSGDPSLAAHSALKIFTWVFGFPPSFELSVEMQ